MLQRALPAGFIAPCLPNKTDKLPSGGQWLHPALLVIVQLLLEFHASSAPLSLRDGFASVASDNQSRSHNRSN